MWCTPPNGGRRYARIRHLSDGVGRTTTAKGRSPFETVRTISARHQRKPHDCPPSQTDGAVVKITLEVTLGVVLGGLILKGIDRLELQIRTKQLPIPEI